MKLLKVYIVCASQIEIGISISFSQDSKHCVFQLNSNNNNTTPHTTFLTQVFKNSIFFLKQSPTIVDFITLTKKQVCAATISSGYTLAIQSPYTHSLTRIPKRYNQKWLRTLWYSPCDSAQWMMANQLNKSTILVVCIRFWCKINNEIN